MGLIEMSDAEYRKAPGYNYSSVKHALKSAAHYRAAMDNPRPATAAMLMGACLDSIALHGSPCWAESEDGITFNTNAGKALERCRAGEITLKPEASELVHGMRLALHSHPDAKAVLAVCKQRKLAAFGEIDGVPCKGQLDGYGLDGGAIPLIFDLKKVQDAADFARDVAKFSYHIQAGLYSELVRQATGLDPMFVWLAVEEQPPHGVIVWQAKNEALAVGLEKFKLCLHRIRLAEALGEWESYPAGIRELNLPLWAMQ